MIVSVAIPAGTAMTDEDFHKLLAAVEALSQPQLTTLDATIRDRLCAATAHLPAAAKTSENTGKLAGDCASITDIEAHFAWAPLCPHCQSAEIAKWGSANRLKRY